MAAINTAIVAREVTNIVKRSNWASKNVGVMIVFCIVFVVAVAVIGLMIHKALAARAAKKPLA